MRRMILMNLLLIPEMNLIVLLAGEMSRMGNLRIPMLMVCSRTHLVPIP